MFKSKKARNKAENLKNSSNNPLKKKYGFKKMETQKFKRSKKQKNLLYNSHVFENKKSKKKNFNIKTFLDKKKNSSHLKLSNLNKTNPRNERNLIKKKKLVNKTKNNQNINSKLVQVKTQLI
jgi:hypothetical protein